MVLIFVVLIRFITEIFSVFMLIHHLALMLRGGEDIGMYHIWFYKYYSTV